MAGRWLGALGVATASLVVVGGAATAVGATSSSGQATTTVSYEYEPDTEHETDDSTPPVAPAPGPTDALTQTVQLEIVGGELSIEPGSVTVDLTNQGGVLRGTLPDVTVVDARGTLEGWRARASMTQIVTWDADGVSRRISAGRATLTPGDTTVIAGSADGLSAGRTIRGRGHGTLASAVRGQGGGTFVTGGTIEIPRPAGIVTATVTIAFSVI